MIVAPRTRQLPLVWSPWWWVLTIVRTGAVVTAAMAARKARVRRSVEHVSMPQHLVAPDEEPGVVDPPAPVRLHVGVDVRPPPRRSSAEGDHRGRSSAMRSDPSSHRRTAWPPAATVERHAGLDPRRVARQLPLGRDRPAPSRARTTSRIRVVASALNHMDLWVTRGQPRPRCPTCRAATWPASSTRWGSGSSGVAVGDEVVVNPAVAPLETIVALGDDAPMWPRLPDPRRAALGRPRRAASSCPARNVVARPAGRSGRSARRSRSPPHRVAHAAPGPAAGGRDGADRRHRRRCVDGRPGARPRAWAPSVYVTSRDEAKRGARDRARARPTPSTRRGDWPVQADVVVESVGPATWEQSIEALAPGRPAGGVRRHVGPDGGAVDLPRLFFKQIEIIGSTMGSYGSSPTSPGSWPQGLPVAVDEEFALDDYPTALARLEYGDQLGKIVLRHDRVSAAIPTRSRWPPYPGRWLISTPSRTGMHDEVDARADVLLDASHQIHDHPELGFEEHFAHDLLTGILEDEGARRRARAPTASTPRSSARAGIDGPDHRRAVRVRRAARHRPRLRPQHHRHRRPRRRARRGGAGRRARRPGR